MQRPLSLFVQDCLAVIDGVPAPPPRHRPWPRRRRPFGISTAVDWVNLIHRERRPSVLRLDVATEPPLSRPPPCGGLRVKRARLLLRTSWLDASDTTRARAWVGEGYTSGVEFLLAPH